MTVFTNKLKNRTFCLTGKASKVRNLFENDITNNGGFIVTKAKNAHYVILGDLAPIGYTSDKIKDAIQLGVPIIQESDFYNYLTNASAALPLSHTIKFDSQSRLVSRIPWPSSRKKLEIDPVVDPTYDTPSIPLPVKERRKIEVDIKKQFGLDPEDFFAD